MHRAILIIISMLCFSGVAQAIELDGDMEDNGNGTYSVTLENNNGFEYQGYAVPRPDGSYQISVRDSYGYGDAYTGFATSDGVGGYDMYLRDPRTGGDATGSLDRE